MSFTNTLPPSVVAKQAKSEEMSDEPLKKSREDYKKMKELEEARKAGTVPAMQDEEGKDINPHIPQYIMQVPWYYNLDHATLKHQRGQDDKEQKYSEKDEWFKKGVKEGPVATRFRKGACENCGALTHKKKDCLERPRKIGAKYTGDNFAPDEHLQKDLSFDYEGKRDRWNGYNPEEHQKVYERFERLEQAKRMLKEATVEQEMLGEGGQEDKQTELKSADSDDEDKYADNVDMPGQKFETKQRITVRNLRIREDTAKYLFNLDVNSSFYDPKTRSMRENPLKGTPKEMEFQGDNLARYSGDAQNFAKKQMFAWQAYEHGTEVHLQADPTKLELLSKEVKKREQENKVQAKSSILEKYGGEEHLEAPPKQLLMAQTEDYVEYSRQGKVVKGAEKPVVRSKYQEDVYINNHTSVWGSFWHEGRWGYKCCYSTIKESYCVGQAGVEAAAVAQQSLVLTEQDEETLQRERSEEEYTEERNTVEKKKKKKKKNKRKKKKKQSSSEESSDEDSETEKERKKEKKLRKALKKEMESQARAKELLSVDERKRPYNSMYDAKAPTEEELEAWHMKRARVEDPMANFT